MGKMVFVPLSDEMIYEHPELITGPIGTFAPGKVECPDLGQAVGKGRHHLPKDKDQVGQIGRQEHQRVVGPPIPFAKVEGLGGGLLGLHDLHRAAVPVASRPERREEAGVGLLGGARAQDDEGLSRLVRGDRWVGNRRDHGLAADQDEHEDKHDPHPRGGDRGPRRRRRRHDHDRSISMNTVPRALAGLNPKFRAQDFIFIFELFFAPQNFPRNSHK